jgi:hypothetical protein
VHQRGLCLCVECIRRDTVCADERELEMHRLGRAMVAGCQRKGPTPERVSLTVVRRRR